MHVTVLTTTFQEAAQTWNFRSYRLKLKVGPLKSNDNDTV